MLGHSPSASRSVKRVIPLFWQIMQPLFFFGGKPRKEVGGSRDRARGFVLRHVYLIDKLPTVL